MKTKKITREEFLSLPNYSCSIPTQTTIGKAWKRAKVYSVQTTDPADWLYCEYAECVPARTGYVQINKCEIAILTPAEAIIRKRLYE